MFSPYILLVAIILQINYASPSNAGKDIFSDGRKGFSLKH